MDADGSNARALGIEGFQPAWSPDGGRIMFGCGRGNPRTEICTANADGTDLRQLTHDREADFLPAWSPDGTTILYTHGFPRSDLYLMGADGSDPPDSPAIALGTSPRIGHPMAPRSSSAAGGTRAGISTRSMRTVRNFDE